MKVFIMWQKAKNDYIKSQNDEIILQNYEKKSKENN